VDTSKAGDTVVVHAGTYPFMVLSDQFTSMVTVKAAAGETVTLQGIKLYRGSFLTFQGFTINSGSNSVDDVQVYSSTHDVVIANNDIKGGRFGIHVERESGQPWPANIDARNNELSNAYVDNVQVSGVRNMSFAYNYDHDPQVNGQHNDGIQVIAADGMVIAHNHFTFVGYNGTGGPNQGIILGRADPYEAERYVNDVTVSANLIDHWEGTPIIVAGTSNVKIVNNTAYDSGQGGTWSGLNLTAKNNPAQFDNTGVQIWNNIFNRMTISSGSSWPTYCDYNLVWPGGGNTCGASLITSSPQFLDHVDYMLQPLSPAIGSGIGRTGTPAADLWGQVYFNPPSRGAHTN
jgi:hypothetical protein